MKKWHYLTALGLLTLASVGFPKETVGGQATFNVSLGLTGYNGFALNHLNRTDCFVARNVLAP